MDNDKLTRLTSRINALRDVLTSVGDTSDCDELLNIIHRPPWTTLAEMAFVETMLDVAEKQAGNPQALRRGLLVGANAVGSARAARVG